MAQFLTMRPLQIGVLAPALLLLLAASPAAQASPALCFPAYQIDHTEIPDDSTILFVMRNHDIYRAHIEGRCTGLANDPRGFTYEPNPGTDDICANFLTIRLNTTHGICLVGGIDRLPHPARR